MVTRPAPGIVARMDHRTQGRPTRAPAILAPVSLEIDHVTKRFAATLALDALTFDVPRGEIFGFLGANGAGKTTTMRICLGILRADTGEVRWNGAPVATLPRRTWGYLPEERGLYPRMAVLDQLVYFASLYGEPPDVARREAAMDWLDRFLIADMAGRRAEELSKGNQQKVQFIAAILHGPQVLLMDEPFTGLDPVNLAILREAFLELRDQGRTLVFSTHQMEAAEALCESVAIVDRGRVVAGGTVAALKRASGRRSLRIAARRRGRACLARRSPGRRRRPARGRPRRARARRRGRAIGDPRRRRGARRRRDPLRGRRALARGDLRRACRPLPGGRRRRRRPGSPNRADRSRRRRARLMADA